MRVEDTAIETLDYLELRIRVVDACGIYSCYLLCSFFVCVIGSVNFVLRLICLSVLVLVARRLRHLIKQVFNNVANVFAVTSTKPE